MKNIGKWTVLAALFWPFLGASLYGGAVTDWHTFKAAPATTLSGQGTSNPVMGSTTLTSVQAFLIGYFDALSLTNQGDRITLSFQASFNDAAGMGQAGDQFRFGLYDIGTSTRATADNTGTVGVAGQTDNWLGYRFGVRSGTGTGSGGSIRERGLGTDLHPLANAQTTPLGSPTGDYISWVSAIDGVGGIPYTGLLALEKTPTGVALAGSFYGNNTTNYFAANDDATPWPANYSAVGYLNGNGTSCDQIIFQDVSVQYGFSNALQITFSPRSLSVIASQPAQFDVSWTGSGIVPRFQWRENGIDIPDATNSYHRISATSLSQDNYTYSVRISNVFGDSVTSADATLDVIADTTLPRVLSVSSLVPDSLSVIFSEPVDPATAADMGSYVVSGNSFSFIELIGTTNVKVTLDNSASSSYSVSVQNVKDYGGNTMTATNLIGMAHGFEGSFGIGITDGYAFALDDKIVGVASGDNIFGDHDYFQYVYKAVSGDFDMEVRVESLENTDLNARAGLMARPQNVFFDTRNVLIEATPTRFIFQYRTNSGPGEMTLAVASPRPATVYPNCWVRLVRNGAVFTAYSSTNHGQWILMESHDTSIGIEGAYPNDIWLGLAISSGDRNVLTRAQFSGLGQAFILPPPPTLSIVLADTNVEVNWDVESRGYTLEQASSLTPPINWSTVANSSTTNRVFVPATENATFFRAIWE